MDLPYGMLFTAVYVEVDDWYQQEGRCLVRSRPGVKPRFSDSEVLTLEGAAIEPGKPCELLLRYHPLSSSPSRRRLSA
ncbi:MAG TPA: hypothetical protein VNL71_11755 [Chloroflexota bacterium]|nr:hypothetical protein [Chloroflexota bacterium]